MLLAGVAASASAQSPTAVESIYSEIGTEAVGDATVAYEFANWYTVESNDNASLWPAIFDAVSKGPQSLIEGVTVDAEGVEIVWNAAEKLIFVKCDDGKLGHTQVLVADYNGVNRGITNVSQSPATISLANYVPGTYVVAVAVDGKLIKTLKLILK